jgi:hypothetical protein
MRLSNSSKNDVYSSRFPLLGLARNKYISRRASFPALCYQLRERRSLAPVRRAGTGYEGLHCKGAISEADWLCLCRRLIDIWSVALSPHPLEVVYASAGLGFEAW